MFKITHYRDKCIGCNACVEVAPDRWRISKKDGKCTLVGAKEKKGIYHVDLPEHEMEENIQAANNCPVKIILINGRKP
ncbi:ferredoxin [Reichenbachiella versicolor]|uniref:ferredoxin n=1 Tax=Reichenbachiella versicolor TaxID=1821036 RepID=UPI000D6E9787|nr:ferredoxin [Reichenbachiella versicolor]